MSDISAVLSLPYLMPAQAQKHVTHNEALRKLDLLVQLSVLSQTLATPPAGAQEGDRYIVASGASGEWAGQAHAIAIHAGTEGWQFTPPLAGWRAWVADATALVVWDGSAWQLSDGHDGLEGVGINATSDAVNRLSVSSPATLLSHEGAGHQLKINKAASGETASLLFQTAWSGRAEMGTAGSDGFAIKVSADGSTWTTALAFDPAQGTATGAAVQQDRLDATPGRLARADWSYGPATLLGPVAQTGGVPDGAVIERGSNADGEYVRFADGTQICIHDVSGVPSDSAIGALFRSPSDLSWTFPMPFATEAALSGNVDSGSSWIVFGGGTETSVVFRRYTAISDPAGRPVRLMAVGRWF